MAVVDPPAVVQALGMNPVRCTLLLFTMAAITTVLAPPVEAAGSVQSPDGRLAVAVRVAASGTAVYEVSRDGEVVLRESQLGLIRDDADFSVGLELTGLSTVERVEDEYETLTSKRRFNAYRGNRRVFHFADGAGREMDVIFQVSNAGVAFRYRFPEQSPGEYSLKEEISSFNFPVGTKAWLQPVAPAKSGWSRTNPSYEEFYEMAIDAGTPSNMGAGWVFPALFRSGDTWFLLSETALDRSYCGTRLRHEAPGGEYRIGFPDPRETMHGDPARPSSNLPWTTPWRLIVIGSLRTIVESNLGLDLATPARGPIEPWMQPGKASWSWVLLGDENTTFDVQKEFIDYAARMGWSYCLIDALWDEQIGYDGIRKLAEHAATKGVGLLLWYNSNGDWNDAPQTPKNRMDTREARIAEFERLKAMSIRGLKVDFFGGDGQPVVEYHLDLIEDAKQYELLMNFHGTTLPRGWSRTHPHLMTMESVRGFEFVTFDQANADRAPSHNSMPVFTRNVFDPMDYTPVAMSGIRNIERRTTAAHELALSVLYTSGIQHIAETPEGMAGVPEFVRSFLKQLPDTWEDVRFVDGYPGELAVIARKGGGRWYLAGINGEAREKVLTIDLSVLPGDAGGEGFIINDGDGHEFVKRSFELGDERRIEVTLKANGGFVARLVEDAEPVEAD